MDDEDRKGVHPALNDEPLDEKCLKDYAMLRLISAKTERDAVIHERDKAIAEKKVAIAEKEAAYAQRYVVIMERDATFAALKNARDERNRGWQAYKAHLAQMAASPHLIQMGACSRDPRIFQAINIHHDCTYGIGANEFPSLTTGTSELGPVLECEAALKSSSKILQMGNGGWQSACCTTMMSRYPLPMNPNKKGYRFQVEK